MKRTLKTDIPAARVDVPGVLLYGLGSIGRMAAGYLVESGVCPLLGAVEINDEAIHALPLEIASRIGPVGPGLPDAAPEGAVALHMAGSHLPEIEEQLTALARAGYSVASSAEELTFPWLQHPEIAARLDDVAKECNVCIAGVGVNPGFVLDFLPLAAATVCRDIERVEARRIVNASTRREPLQRKIGSGMTPTEFNALADAGKIGHVGLIESCAFVGDALGLKVDTIEEELSPVLAGERIETDFFTVEPGQVCGIDHRARGLEGDDVRVSLVLQMFLGAADARDEVRILGRPELTLRVPSGTPGDFATVAALINAIPRVAMAEPGLRTMRDLPFVI